MDLRIFNTYPSIYWSDKTKIEYLQRRVIIYSIMYYENNESCVDDFYYNDLSQLLFKFQSKVEKEILKKTKYYYCFKDFDGSTGFDLYSKLNFADKKYLSYLANLIYSRWLKTGKCNY